MAINFTRKLQQIFGGSLAASGNIGKFGSAAAGSPGYSLDPDQIQTARFLSAWAAAVLPTSGGLASPALQDMNGLFYLLTYQLSYLLQKGMADWLVTQTYFTNDFVKVGSAVFISKTDNNVGNNPLTDTNNWMTQASTLVTGAAQAKAWVCFNGVTGGIYSQYNVSGINKTATGCYTILFTNSLANALYAWAGSAGTPAGGAFGNGDDNIITGGFSGRTSIKAASQFSVFCSDPQDRNLQDSQAISIQVFGN